MLREARRRARLSQTDLARPAGVAQSVISAYEANHREPGLRTLTKLLGATGHQLAVELVPGPRNRLGLSDARLGRRLRRHRRAVLELTAQREHATSESSQRRSPKNPPSHGSTSPGCATISRTDIST
ncbi:MAG TPA: helix-turn-helix transcriptional regulator, partial [Kribbella sp.]